jgi:uncharacterized protein (DUF433 family)
MPASRKREIDGQLRERMRRGEAMEIFPGISVDPGIRFGKPCLAGTRVDVATVIDALGAGESYESVEREYQLTRVQILTALRYAAHVAAHQPPAVKAA